MKLVVWVGILAGLAAAEVRTGRLHGRDVWILDSGQARIGISYSGGHFVQMVLAGPEEVNPLWIQQRPTQEAERYLASRDEARFGGGSGARLMASLLGHNLCFPFWGNPTPAEYRAGMTFHGETGVARWQRVTADGETLTIRADLPESRTAFTRSIRVAGQVAYFDSRGINLAAWDRPVGWCEHATIGPPFLERGVTRMDLSVTRGRANGDESGKETRWPHGLVEGKPLDLRTVRPAEKAPGFVNNFLVDPTREYAFVAATHPGRRLVFGYVFRRADFPWLNVWEANSPEMLTRGLEFSNTPTHGTMRALYQAKPLFGTPMFDWLDARSTLRKRFAAFLVRTPDGFQGVADVRLKDNQLEIVEAEGRGRVVTIEFDPSFFGRP